MATFLEGYFSEDSNGLDNGEAEAALYSLVHHSEETYSSNMLDLSGHYISKRNKADRWETFKHASEFMKPGNYILHPREDNCTLDHIPLSKDSTANTTRTMYGQQFSKRGKFFKYPWNNQRREIPWNVQGRMGNLYMNRNHFPVYTQGKPINGQHFADPQELLKINQFGSFENTPNFSYNDLHNFQFSGGFEPVMYNGGISNQRVMSSCQTGINANESWTPVTNSPCLEASSSKQQKVNASGNAVEGASGNVCKESVVTQQPSPKKKKKKKKKKKNNSSSSPTGKKVHKIVDISDENASDEVIIVSETDDNDSERSIVEMSVPAKPAPPIIALDSSDETESSFLSNATPILNISGHGDVSAVETPNTSPSTSVSYNHTKDSVLGISSNSKEIKKNKKKKNKQGHVKPPACATWTAGMIKFYNQSWGGETYDHMKLQEEMTNSPAKWKILDIDRYGPLRSIGPRVRCTNCNQYGHRTNQCPDPIKVQCCAMCGQQGHHENQCPNKICLKCGRSARLYNEGCPSCWDKNHPRMCTECGGVDHYQWLCPNVWRKFHSITTTEEFQPDFVQEAVFKSPSELACCVCAGKGHIAGKCSSVPRQSQSGSPSVDVIAVAHNNKKRKKKRISFFEGKYENYEYNWKRRKTH